MTTTEKINILENLLMMTTRTAYRRLKDGKFTELEISVLKKHGLEELL